MSTEQQGAPVQPEPAPESTTPNQDFRNSQLAQQTFAQLKQLQDKLAAMEQAEADKKAEEERKRLEAEGNYKEALAKQQAEFEALKAQQAKMQLDHSLQSALMREGVTNQMFINGVLSSYNGDADGVGEFISSLKSDESNAVFFGTAHTPGISVPQTGAPAGSNKTNWSALKADTRFRIGVIHGNTWSNV